MNVLAVEVAVEDLLVMEIRLMMPQTIVVMIQQLEAEL